MPPVRCSKCHTFGHYASTCNKRIAQSKSSASKTSCCTRCGRQGHRVSQCYATTKATKATKATKPRGTTPRKSTPKPKSNTSSKPRTSSSSCTLCRRCGRKGHSATQCYATTSVTHSTYSTPTFTYVLPNPSTTMTGTTPRRRTARITSASSSSSSSSSRESGVYVLVLDNGYRYVGKSSNIAKRVQEHLSGVCGSAWCKKWGLSEVQLDTPLTPPLQNLALWEQHETLMQMYTHGFHCVRGWEFTSCSSLSSVQRKTIHTLLCGAHDWCRKCGRDSHMAANCYAKSQADWVVELNGK